ncbi:hypothetical protein LJR039_004330 [Pseudorhodoferax sp. LjRoot39]|uniref:hypothetical protein n=1 Tax=Pseudorhodoferax sp. LjRoot39 TaxID=3342328 RepID=UPI003ECEE764
MGRYTDDHKAANAIRAESERRAVPPAVDEEGFTVDYHLAHADIALANAKRAHSMGIEGSLQFEARQVIAHLQKAIGLSVIKEAMQ